MFWIIPSALVVAGALLLWHRRRETTTASPDSGIVRAIAPIDTEEDVEDDPEDAGETLWIPLARTDIADGCFLVAFEDESEERYVTLWTHRVGNKRKISYLRGPDNTAQYVAVGRVESGGVHIASVYATNEPIVRAVHQLFGGHHVEAHERFLRDSADFAARTLCCGRCGHPISNVLSVWRGLGPECFTKAGNWHLC